LLLSVVALSILSQLAVVLVSLGSGASVDIDGLFVIGLGMPALYALGSGALLFAGEDEAITAESVVGFRSALRRAGKNAELRIYPQMRHEFATPGSDSYSAEAAEDAWTRTIDFLNLHLR